MEKRLQLILSHYGISSRRKAAEIIEDGRVTVNGKVVREKGLKADPEKQEIRVDNKLIGGEEKNLYFLLNKPKDVISTAEDTHDRKKVTDFFRRIKVRLYPVGRLDKDTTGLIILTNDGELTYRLSHPSFEIEKEYLVTVNGNFTSAMRDKMEKGVEIDGKMTHPCKIRLKRKKQNETVLRVTLHEGRNRQIKKMFACFDLRVKGLDRVKYAGLTIGKLKRGEYRTLSKDEISRLKKIK